MPILRNFHSIFFCQVRVRHHFGKSFFVHTSGASRLEANTCLAGRGTAKLCIAHSAQGGADIATGEVMRDGARPRPTPTDWFEPKWFEPRWLRIVRRLGLSRARLCGGLRASSPSSPSGRRPDSGGCACFWSTRVGLVVDALGTLIDVRLRNMPEKPGCRLQLSDSPLQRRREVQATGGHRDAMVWHVCVLAVEPVDRRVIAENQQRRSFH